MASFETRSNSVRVRIMRGGKKVSKTFPNRPDAELWASRMERKLEVRGDLEGGRALLSMIPKRVLEAITNAEFTAADVLAGAIHSPAGCGIYFLMLDGAIRYIGKTTDLHLRLSKHRRDGRAFDSYNFLPCPDSELDRIERMYIEAFMPSENMKF